MPTFSSPGRYRVEIERTIDLNWDIVSEYLKRHIDPLQCFVLSGKTFADGQKEVDISNIPIIKVQSIPVRDRGRIQTNDGLFSVGGFFNDVEGCFRVRHLKDKTKGELGSMRFEYKFFDEPRALFQYDVEVNGDIHGNVLAKTIELLKSKLYTAKDYVRKIDLVVPNPMYKRLGVTT